MNSDAWVEINLDNLRHNINLIKNQVEKGVDLMAVIKADAYGHGQKMVSKVLIEEGVKNFAFARLREAVVFKEEHKDENALILGMYPKDCEDKVIKYGIEQAVQSFEMAKKLDEEAKKQGKKSKVHLKIDTGMSRFGFVPNEKELNDMIKIFELENTEIIGMFTHFTSSADEGGEEFCKEQIRLFEIALDFIRSKGYKLPKVHASNSGGILLTKPYHFDMVRSGIITYGLKPSDLKKLDKFELKPLMSLKARIVRIREFEAGRTVGYSRRYELKNKERIATLPVGYADGLMAGTDNSYKVYLNGERHNLAGRICMDAMMIRINDNVSAKEGDVVTIFGDYGDGIIPIEEMAEAMGRINYELACAVKMRLNRYYISQGEFIKED